MAEVILSLILPACYFTMAPSLLTLFISICEYHRAFFEMFKFQIKEIDKINTSELIGLQKNAHIKQSIHNSIVFHNSVKV